MSRTSVWEFLWSWSLLKTYQCLLFGCHWRFWKFLQVFIHFSLLKLYFRIYFHCNYLDEWIIVLFDTVHLRLSYQMLSLWSKLPLVVLVLLVAFVLVNYFFLGFLVLFYDLLDLSLWTYFTIGLQEIRMGFYCPIPPQTKVIPLIMLLSVALFNAILCHAYTPPTVVLNSVVKLI